jgi:hypothetical protein
MYLVFSIIYVASSLYWFYKVVLYYNYMGSYQKFINLLIPLTILENLMYQQIYNEINNAGRSQFFYELVLIFCSLSKNLLLRIIVILISLGFEFITNKIKKKNTISWFIILLSYSIAFITYSIFSKLYKNK